MGIFAGEGGLRVSTDGTVADDAKLTADAQAEEAGLSKLTPAEREAREAKIHADMAEIDKKYAQERANAKHSESNDARKDLSPEQQQKLTLLAKEVFQKHLQHTPTIGEMLHKANPFKTTPLIESPEGQRIVEQAYLEKIIEDMVLAGPGWLPESISNDILTAREKLYAPDFNTGISTFDDLSQSWMSKIQHTSASSTQETGISTFDDLSQ